MTSYMDVISWGAVVGPRATGRGLSIARKSQQVDIAEFNRATLPRVKQAILERIELVKSGVNAFPVQYGLCETCGCEQQNYRAGRCPLCCAAAQKAAA